MVEGRFAGKGGRERSEYEYKSIHFSLAETKARATQPPPILKIHPQLNVCTLFASQHTKDNLQPITTMVSLKSLTVAALVGVVVGKPLQS